jgi:GntR family transcriptional regulator, transcriptional repressor for pyruvate dehydrogenase complex
VTAEPEADANGAERSRPRDRFETSASRYRPRKTATLLAQRIVGEISSRSLPPGTMLASEREMLERYGVARGTLREALRFLEMQGVITIKPGPAGGPTVNLVAPRSLASAIALLLQLSNARFATILETRRLLEPELAALSASRASPEDIDRLRASVEAMGASLGDTETFLAENREFHDLVADASGNELFSLLVRSLEWITDASVLGVEYRPSHRAGILKAHKAILSAIATADGPAAADAMRVHMTEYAQFLGRHYPAVLDKPVLWDETVN